VYNRNVNRSTGQEANMYFIVRVNTDEHQTIEQAMQDMAYIIEKRAYWKKSVRPTMPVGSPIIAIGGHGGRGLFLHGVVRKDWKAVSDGGVYANKLGVQWDNTVYMHPQEAVSAALVLANRGALRAHSQITKDEYRALLGFVLSGQAINPWLFGNDEDEEVAA
jgi:hypothetical protein